MVGVLHLNQFLYKKDSKQSLMQKMRIKKLVNGEKYASGNYFLLTKDLLHCCQSMF